MGFQLYKSGQGRYVRGGTGVAAAIVVVVVCMYCGTRLNLYLPTELKSLTVEWQLKDGSRQTLGGSQVLHLKAAYYEGKWEKLPNFESLTAAGEREPRGLDVAEFGHGNYGVVFTGEIDVRKAGEYTFFLRSHDGSRLLVDGKPVVANDGLHSPEAEQSGTVTLAGGAHPFRLEYFQALSAADIFYATRVYLVYGIPAVLFAVLGVVVFFYLNKPKVVDFLVATETEMKKVAWSSRAELLGSTAVVIVTVFALALFIYFSDMIFTYVFRNWLRLW